MVTTIIFDLYDVILHGMKGVEVKIGEIIGQKIVEKFHLNKESNLFFHGLISEDEYWNKLVEKYQWKITFIRLKQLVREMMVEIEGARELLLKLKNNGYKLGLLSINCKEWVYYCEEKFKYHNYFHSVMYSFEVGISKPDPQSYILILDKLKVTPNECLFIDDNIKNIESAKIVGLQTIQFFDSKQLAKDLRKIHIRL